MLEHIKGFACITGTYAPPCALPVIHAFWERVDEMAFELTLTEDLIGAIAFQSWRAAIALSRTCKSARAIFECMGCAHALRHIEMWGFPHLLSTCPVDGMNWLFEKAITGWLDCGVPRVDHGSCEERGRFMFQVVTDCINQKVHDIVCSAKCINWNGTNAIRMSISLPSCACVDVWIPYGWCGYRYAPHRLFQNLLYWLGEARAILHEDGSTSHTVSMGDDTPYHIRISNHKNRCTTLDYSSNNLRVHVILSQVEPCIARLHVKQGASSLGDVDTMELDISYIFHLWLEIEPLVVPGHVIGFGLEINDLDEDEPPLMQVKWKDMNYARCELYAQHTWYKETY